MTQYKDPVYLLRLNTFKSILKIFTISKLMSNSIFLTSALIVSKLFYNKIAE